MGKHSRRPPGDERLEEPVDAPAAEAVTPGLMRDAEGRVVLQHVDGASSRVDANDGNSPDEPPATVQDPVPTEPGEQTSRRRHPARRALDAARRGRRRTTEPLEEVGGPIQPTPTVYFGRPPGTENRRAGAAALVGCLLLLGSSIVPWATRSPESVAASLGWRDASGGFGPGPWILVLGLTAGVLAVSALAGSNARALQIIDVVVGSAAIVTAVVEWRRIADADDVVSTLTDGRAGLSPGWGVVLAAVGGLALVVAAAVHRNTPPAWRQA
jgi:hypothetical protein